jgi:general stress protein YciG
MNEEQLKAAMREMGARGGRRRYEALTPEQLSEIGRKGGVKSGKARAKKAGKKPLRRVKSHG